MSLTHADVRRILDILDHANRLESLQVTVGDFVLHASKGGPLPSGSSVHEYAAKPSVAQASAAGVPTTQVLETPSVGDAIPDGMVAVRAPMIGTFYKRPQPDQPAFVEEGVWVEEGAPIALLEAMKLFNTISAPVSGRVARVAASDGKVVDRDTVLVIINPEEKA